MLNDDDLGRMTKGPKPKFKAPRIRKTTADVSGIVEVEHAKYQIKAGRLAGTFVARAFPKQSAKAQGVIAEASGDSESTAIAALMSLIAARDVKRSEDRRWDSRSELAIPSEIEFVEALGQVRLTQAQVAMLRALAIADEGLSYGQLAHSAGYKSKETGAKVFKRIGELIADYLTIQISDDDASGAPGPVRLLAVGDTSTNDDAPVIWKMHDELRIAVRTAL